MRQELERVRHGLHVWAYGSREFLQDAYDLALFSGFQFADAVVGLDHGSWLNEDGAARGTLVVHNALKFLFERRGYGYDQTAVAHGGSHVACNETLLLRLSQNVAQAVRNAAHGLFQLAARLLQLGRSAVLHLSVFVENTLDESYYFGEHVHLFGHGGQCGIAVVCRRRGSGCGVVVSPFNLHVVVIVRCIPGRRVVVSTILHECLRVGMDGVQGAFQQKEVLLLHVGAFGAGTQQGFAHIEEVALRLFVSLVHVTHVFAVDGQRLPHVIHPRHEAQLALHPLGAKRRKATPLKHGAYLREADLLFKILGIDHNSCSKQAQK